MSDIRVRFAPSPTGSLHVGNARTALLNWIFARRHGGTFILRIEDTDLDRSTQASETAILEDLRWLGLDWAEGPDVGGPCGSYRQSERAAAGVYHDVVRQLRQKGRAYPCFCSAEELEAERQAQLAAGKPLKYSGKCRALAPEAGETRCQAGAPHVARFRPDGAPITIHDLVLGDVRFEGDVLDDFILYRSNGLPSYNFAVVVDDAAMGITHVIRGNDHMSNTPKQMAIIRAMGYALPQYAHIPMILGEDGARLSKRDGATSVGEFRDMGILPDALINFLSLLSWSSPSGEEVLSREQLIAEFDFSRISKSAARFDREKLKWMNGVYIRQLPPDALAGALRPFIDGPDDALLRKIAGVIQPKLEYLTDVAKLAAMFLEERPALSGEALEAVASGEAVRVLELFRDAFRAAGDYSEERLKGIVKDVQKAAGVKGPGLWKPLRYALTGMEHGPELVQVIPVLGFEKCGDLCASALAQVGNSD